MPITRRAACASLLFTGAALRTAGALASELPSGTIKVVAPFVAGGAADVLARAISQRLATKYGQTFVVENKPGMGGNLGASTVAAAKGTGARCCWGPSASTPPIPCTASCPTTPTRTCSPS